MPLDVSSLVRPATTALVVTEMQGNMVGEGLDSPLAQAARAIVPRIADLTQAARGAGVQVVHCLKVFRRDSLGRNRNIVLYRRRDARSGSAPEAAPAADSRPVPGTEVLPELGPDERDVVVTRLHGMSSIYDTGVDPLLRTFGVTSVVVTGISVNIGVMNVVMDLVNRGYDVIVPADAVAGTPESYTSTAIEHTIRFLATMTTTADLLATWRTS
jgi:biuret amidohydrolase